MTGEVIRCEKWTRQADGIYQCAQTGGSRYGCKSSIPRFQSIDDILGKDQRKDRRAYIEDVKKIIAEGDRAALVLGAGISKNARMPAWSGLISKMMGYAVQYDLLNRNGSGVTEDLGEKKRLLELTESLMKGDLELLGKVNTLESAEYVAQLFDIRAPDSRLSHTLEGRAISAMVRQMVNNSLPPGELLLDKKTDLLDELRKYGDPTGMTTAQIVEKLGARKVAESDSMCAVVYLLSAERGIRRAMTYNYDPLVQEYMMELYGTKSGELLTHPGARGRGGPGEKARELYHVHGFVPGERHLAKGDQRVFPRESDPIILSEDSYYRIEQEEAYNWSSSIQSYLPATGVSHLCLILCLPRRRRTCRILSI